jgi:sporulation protein YlmC with PRC-barrel domain
LADAPLLENPYNSVNMIVDFDVINLVGDYMVVNELKSPYENNPF